MDVSVLKRSTTEVSVLKKKHYGRVSVLKRSNMDV